MDDKSRRAYHPILLNGIVNARSTFIVLLLSLSACLSNLQTESPIPLIEKPTLVPTLTTQPLRTPILYQPGPTSTPAKGVDSSQNLLQNPGFENDFNGWGLGDDPTGVTTEIDTTIAHSGSKSLRITFDGGADVAYYQLGQDVAVEPNTTYLLQGYMRVDGIRAYPSVVLGVQDGRGWDYLGYVTPGLYTTQDWKLVSTVAFTTLSDTQTLRAWVGRASIMGDKFPISGTVWLDDISLVRLPPFITPSVLTLRVGGTQELSAGNGTPPFAWTSNSPAVAVVQPADDTTKAQVKALSPGEANITALDAKGRTALLTLSAIDQSVITIHVSNVLREVPEAMFGSNVNYFDTGVGRPDWEDVIQDPVFIQDVAELGITNLRFPGGTFSNYYDFSIGKGYIDWGEKSDQYNWTGITTDQFLQFLHDTGIPHAMITANVYKSGYKYWPGDNWISAQVAADWVDYFNHKSGFRVEYWELGNEVFYNGQIPWWNDPQVPGLTQDLYIQKIHEWSRAMQAVDPTIKIGASVEFPMPSGDLQAWWTLPIIQENAKDIDFLIVHPYVRVNDYMVDGKYVDSTAANAYAWIWATKPIVALRGWLDAYAPSRSKAIEIQASEWAVIAFPENPDTHSDTMLNAVLTTDLFWDMVNEGVDGANLYSLCSWGFQTLESVSGGRKFAQYHIMWMNRHRSGKRLVESQMTSPTYSVDPLGGDKSNGRVDGVPYLSAYATLNDDKSRLYLIITNKSGELQPAIINLDGFTPQSQASVWQMTSARWDDTGMQPVTSMITNGTSTFTYTFPARSVTSFIFEVQPG